MNTRPPMPRALPEGKEHKGGVNSDTQIKTRPPMPPIVEHADPKPLQDKVIQLVAAPNGDLLVLTEQGRLFACSRERSEPWVELYGPLAG